MLAAIGKAAAVGEITPAEALDLARMVDTAIRAVAARDPEFRENYFWGREPAPAAPPLPPPRRRLTAPDPVAGLCTERRKIPVIPGQRAVASPEPIYSVLWNKGSGLAAFGRAPE